ncbi:MAG: hypothetical protein MUF10_02605 [Thermoanaerobaculaceae bacterium]|jgi:hypothetical protein|nr:hypothetical protein [Thermoanaerobaculaceae bacterium]
MPLVPTLLATLVLAQATPVPADLAAYFEEIRLAGCTESASDSLEMVAGILVGETVLTFPRDPSGRTYGNYYRSSEDSCPLPGPSSPKPEALRTDRERTKRAVLSRLRVVADTDHSGFVSTIEGSHLRRVYEFGAKAAFLTSQEGKKKADLLDLLHVSESELGSLTTEYRHLAVQLSGLQSLTLPEIPAEWSEATRAEI